MALIVFRSPIYLLCVSIFLGFYESICNMNLSFQSCCKKTENSKVT